MAVWKNASRLQTSSPNTNGFAFFVLGSSLPSETPRILNWPNQEPRTNDMKSLVLSDNSRRTFLQGSAGTLAVSAGLLEHANAETLYGVETPELRSRAEVAAVLGKAPKAAAESSLRPLTVLFAGGTKDHLPKTHSHDVLPKRWQVLLGGAGPGGEAVTNLYRPQVEADQALITAGLPQVKALSTLEWPTEEQFATADVIMLYQNPKCWSDASHLRQVEAFRNLRWREIRKGETITPDPDPDFEPMPVTGEALEKERAWVQSMLEKKAKP